MIVDRAASMLSVAGRWVPAVGLLCPPIEGEDNPRAHRLLGGDEGGGGWYVPCESGLLVEVDTSHWGSARHVALYARSCHLCGRDDDALWLPRSVKLTGKTLRSDEWGSRWDGADEEWVYELIRRVERYEFTQPPGPEVEIVPVAEALELLTELREERARAGQSAPV